MAERKKVLVAMSGGVDSSAAVSLALQSGYEVGGAIMRLWDKDSSDIEDAKRAAEILGIPFFVFDLREEFKREVVDRFISCYLDGKTPNPCIFCNKALKFDRFLDLAITHGYTHIATGHYVIKDFDEISGRWRLLRAPDSNKDQSYVLYNLTQYQLEHIVFPCGELSKKQIKKIAAERELVSDKRKESQDICFIPDGDYAAFIERQTNKVSKEGDFVLTDGRVLGRHKGLIRYTIGQRRGLGVSFSEPLFVTEKDVKNNRVVLGRAQELFSSELTACEVNFVSIAPPTSPITVMAQTRYHQAATEAILFPLDNNRVRLLFKEPKRAISKGQAVVFYDGDYVLGGGTIE